jgi:hypothetical protein
MAFSIDSFKNSAIPAGGYRPALFDVQVTRLGQEMNFLCQSSQVPAMTMGVIEVPYFGRKIKVAGDRTYAEWTTLCMIEENFSLRNELELWQEKINGAETNSREEVFEAYKTDATVQLYGKGSGAPIRTYNLTGCWPSDVGTIELDWNTTDTIGTYTVTWSFDSMLPGTGS